MTLHTERIQTLDQMRAFLEGNEPVDFQIANRTSAYVFVRRTLVRFEYHGLGKPDKGLVKRFVKEVTGTSHAQVPRLILQPPDGTHPRPPRAASCQRLSAPLHDLGRRLRPGLSGSATKEILLRSTRSTATRLRAPRPEGCRHSLESKTAIPYAFLGGA